MEEKRKKEERKKGKGVHPFLFKMASLFQPGTQAFSSRPLDLFLCLPRRPNFRRIGQQIFADKTHVQKLRKLRSFLLKK